MPYAADFKPGDAVRVINVQGADLPGLPRKLVGVHGIVAEPTPRILAKMGPTEVPVMVAIPMNDRKNAEKETATYLLFPEYLERVENATTSTRTGN